MKVHFSYIIDGYVATSSVDTYFYSFLPNVQTEVTDLRTGRPVTDIPPLEQSVRVTGMSDLPSDKVAAIISEYLKGDRRSRIVLEGPDKRIEYTGPDLKASPAQIEESIRSLITDRNDSLTVMSYHSGGEV
jgi:hypothetical protein